MATRLYTLSPNGNVSNVIEGVGAAASSAQKINLVIDLSTTLVTDASIAAGTRGATREEILRALDTFRDYILADTWPPA